MDGNEIMGGDMRDFIWAWVITLAIVFVLPGVLVYVLHFAPHHSPKKLCLEYEREGTLEQGSCRCAEQIFDTWEESYDWIDACEILKARKESV